METTPLVNQPTGIKTRKPVLVAGGLGVAASLALTLFLFWGRKPESPTPSAPSAPVPWPESPYLNARLNVKYVGDEACAGCHQDHTKGYREHPMGQSFFASDKFPVLENYGDAKGITFDLGRWRYAVRRQGGKIFHKEWCQDDLGQELAGKEVEITHMIGSGIQGRTYIFHVDGFFFQSPISWYRKGNRWDLSPGYQKAEIKLSFNRPIGARCLFCHCNDANPVEHTMHQYHEPLFQQHAIGCERCHGPGQIHVEKRRDGWVPEDVDLTIVNPRRLAPTLRDNVCEQCHLQGQMFVQKRGRGVFDFRPGLPLEAFQTVFVGPPEFREPGKSVGQVEQVYESTCYKKSGGRFGCISCHDPHDHYSGPDDSETFTRAAALLARKMDFFRGRCQQCHGEQTPDKPHKRRDKPCSETPEKRQAKNDSCIDCHMPRNPSADVVHAAVTDHRVLRLPHRPPKAPPRLPGDSLMLIPFPRTLGDSQDPELSRDLGVGLVQGSTFSPKSGQVLMCGQALGYLNDAVDRAPDDWLAWGAKGFAHYQRGGHAHTLKAVEKILAHIPRHEQALTLAAKASISLGKLDEAVAYAQRLVQTNPHSAENHLRLAQVHSLRQDWWQTLAAAKAAMQQDPFNGDARSYVILGHFHTGHSDRARTEFDLLGVLDPAYQGKFRPQYENLMK